MHIEERTEILRTGICLIIIITRNRKEVATIIVLYNIFYTGDIFAHCINYGYIRKVGLQ